MGTDNGVSLSRQEVRVWGRNALPMLAVIAALAAFLGWLYVTHNARVEAAIAEHEAIRQEIKQNTDASRRVVEEMTIQTWVSIQSDAERARLRERMQMPDALRQRLIGGRGAAW